MQEITRLKHSVSLIETIILANHRNLPYNDPLTIQHYQALPVHSR